MNKSKTNVASSSSSQRPKVIVDDAIPCPDMNKRLSVIYAMASARYQEGKRTQQEKQAQCEQQH
jgi:hypothetical protein